MLTAAIVKHRITTWSLARALSLRCALTRHNYGQHFTAMGLAAPSDGELPWCERCGAPQADRAGSGDPTGITETVTPELASAHEVTVRIADAVPLHPGYPLLPGDLLIRNEDDSYTKVAPGIAVGGIRLSDSQSSTLRPARFAVAGLNYYVEHDLAA